MNTEKAHTEKLTRLSNLMLKRIEKEIEPSLEKNLARLISGIIDSGFRRSPFRQCKSR